MTLDAQTIIYLILIGITAGVVSGFIGIGGGIIIVPALIYLVGLSQLQAQGTSLALMLPPIGILAFMQYYKAENVDIDLRMVAIVASTFIVGGLFGAKLALKINVNLVKIIFGVLMLLISIKMIYSGYKLYFGK
ncbi:MAG: sulfite exporter TauE/SafE family protein [Flavobacteriales bacterium]|nr:sulfite exporter TauE/SafE family protein [Flavobacteriales bacterium]